MNRTKEGTYIALYYFLYINYHLLFCSIYTHLLSLQKNVVFYNDKSLFLFAYLLFIPFIFNLRHGNKKIKWINEVVGSFVVRKKK